MSQPEPKDTAVAGDESPVPEEESEVSFDPESVFAFVRAEAARSDPDRACVHRSATPRRIKNAGWTAYDLMAAHLELRRRIGRGARSGRRKHAQEVYRLLESTNDANLVLAQALMLAAIGMLPPDTSRSDD